MTGLLDTERGEKRPVRPGCRGLLVRGRRYANSAAKFWPSLIDEVQEEHPDCTDLELVAPGEGTLGEADLHPEIGFRESLSRLLERDMVRTMRDTLAEMELLGPPGEVCIRLLAGSRELATQALPLDCVDAEIFSYLLVWPLEWAGVPAAMWNNEFVQGEFSGEDRERGLVYEVSFVLTNRHLSEGLYQRKLSVTPCLSAWA